MRITYIHQYFVLPSGVGGTRSYEMARRLVAKGHTVNMVTAQCERHPANEGNSSTGCYAGIHVYWIHVPYSNYMGYMARLKAFGQFAVRAALVAGRLEADLVFASSTPLTVALPGIYAARRCRIPFVFEVRDLWPEIPIALSVVKHPLLVWLARRLESLAYRHAAQIVALSPDTKAGITKQGIEPERIRIIPNCSNLGLFDVPASQGAQFRCRHDWMGERPMVIYTGALGVVNGVPYLARLAAAVRKIDPEICFIVAGRGREEAEVTAVARELGVLDTSFFMLGSVSKHDVPALLSASQVAMDLIIDKPALWAASPNKFFDALAAGRPIALNHEGWLADLLRDNGAGIVLPPGDFGVAARMLVGLLRDPVRLARAGAAAQRLARSQFACDSMADRLEEVLLSAVHSH